VEGLIIVVLLVRVLRRAWLGRMWQSG